MATYIALLRGINVSGKNIIKMTELKQLFLIEGFKNVTTYIQSGNIIFNTTENSKIKLEQTIKTAIKNQFGYTINLLVLTKQELETVFYNNPFIVKNTEIDITKLYVSLLNTAPDLNKISEIKAFIVNSDDEFIITEKRIYLYLPNGSAKTKLTNNLFEKKLKTVATTRNWKSITKLIELSNQ